MMHAVLLLAMMAPPFWETKTPDLWSEEQLAVILTDSPWAQAAVVGNAPPVLLRLASARPVREAETEWARRRNVPLDPEYVDFLEAKGGEVIVLAVRMGTLEALAEAEEAKRMERESVMKLGRRRLKLIGHFPPTPSDPYLRLLFPRDVRPSDKEIAFELYVPGVTSPYREAMFDLKSLMCRGRPEF
jgi:hypothetical protein